MKIYKKKKNKTGVPVSEMRDGDIGVVVHWGNPDPVRKILQRHGNKLICLGEKEGKSYSGITTDINCRVKILPKGALLEI